jgi:hypothetical protein
MVRWKDRLDLRILILVVTLPLVGVLAVSFGVLNLIRSGFVDVARRQSESTAEIITHNIERTMVAGQVDITRSMVKDMRLMAGSRGRPAERRGAEGEGRVAAERRLERSGPKARPSYPGGRPRSTALQNVAECHKCHDAEEGPARRDQSHRLVAGDLPSSAKLIRGALSSSGSPSWGGSCG